GNELRDLGSGALRRRNLAPLDLQTPDAATFDRATGEWLVLDAGARSIVGVDPEAAGTVQASSRISLASVGAGSVEGVAYNPADKLLYVAKPDAQRLYGVARSGKVKKVYDIGEVGLRDLGGMVFAPTADSTDNPAAMSLFVADAGSATTAGRVAEVSLAAVAAAEDSATLVRTVQTSSFSPPSPDPSDVAYLPATGRLLVADSEVEEMSIYNGKNLWETTRAGAVIGTGTTHPNPSDEPTGVSFNPATGNLFVSDDTSPASVFEVRPGGDGRFGTGDDAVVTSFRTTTFGNSDPEDVTVDTSTGDLYLMSGTNKEVYRIRPGADGSFGGSDNIVTNFDVGVFGALDPEGLAYNAGSNTLYIADKPTKKVYEVTKAGALVRTIGLAAANPKKVSGIVLAPGSSASQTHMYITDRGVDNDSNPNENDGKMYEMAAGIGGGGPVPNTAPTANAGQNESVVFPNAASLTGSVSDDGLPNPPATVTHQWSKVSGPGTVTFGNSAALSTTATFSVAGTYVLRLTANDSALTGTDEVTVTSTEPGGGGQVTLALPVSAGTDDAEESSTGAMDLNSSDIELVTEGGAPQTVGLRFAGLNVPSGATITNAYVQFQVDEIGSGAGSLTVQGQDADNATTFTTATNNVSSRPRTGASVGWVPAPWPTVGAAGPDQRTPNLSQVVQEIVDRGGWASGHALALIVTGTGKRTAEAFNGTLGPVLHVVYQTGGPPADAPPVAALTVTPASGVAPHAVTADASASTDTDATPIASYAFNFGDGTAVVGPQAGATTTHTYNTPGPYTVTVTVTDTAGLSSTATDTVNVTSTPVDAPPVAALTVTPASGVAPHAVTADASASTDTDATPIASYAFNFGDGTAVVGPQTGATTTHTYNTAGPYTVTVTVTDTAGLSSTATDTVTVTAPGGGGQVTLDLPLSASTDDAEESSTGVMDINSSDIELVMEGGGPQTVGLRFAGLTVPSGATITNAYVQFQVDEIGTSAGSLTVAGQDADNATTFTSAVNNVSSRPRTTASVGWVPAPWPTVGVAGPDQRTPDLSQVVQEIVDRGGWASGHALALVVTGTGKRTAEAFDGTSAPVLHVVYQP
ncbi:MAG: PKD domain-containing protein, partial [Actinomycetes bacterium]